MPEQFDPGSLPRFPVPAPYAELVDRVDVMAAAMPGLKLGLKVAGGQPKIPRGFSPWSKAYVREWEALIVTTPDQRVFREAIGSDLDGACHRMIGHLESLA